MPLSTLLASRNISTEKAPIDNNCVSLTNFTGQLFHTEHLGNQILVKSVLSMHRLTFPVGSKGLAGNPKVCTRYCPAPADSHASSL